MLKKVPTGNIKSDGTIELAFCATGSGGGVDLSCGKGGGSGPTVTPGKTLREQGAGFRARLAAKIKQDEAKKGTVKLNPAQLSERAKTLHVQAEKSGKKSDHAAAAEAHAAASSAHFKAGNSNESRAHADYARYHRAHAR